MHLVPGRWRLVTFARMDGAGRAIWQLPRGTYTLRALFGDASDLAGARSKAIRIRN